MANGYEQADGLTAGRTNAGHAEPERTDRRPDGRWASGRYGRAPGRTNGRTHRRTDGQWPMASGHGKRTGWRTDDQKDERPMANGGMIRRTVGRTDTDGQTDGRTDNG